MTKANYQILSAKINVEQILGFFVFLLSIGLLTLDINFLTISYPYKFLQNYSHVIIFMIIIQTVYILLPIETYKLCITLLIAVFLALSTEIFQIYNSRDADLFDLLFNFIGISIAILWNLLKNSSSKMKRQFIKICLFTVVSIIISSFLFRFSSILYNQHRYNAMLPILADFENEWELGRWVTRGETEFALSKDYHTHGNFCFKVAFDTSNYSRIDMRLIPQNWSQYMAFCFDVFNPQNEILDLHVRFYDSHSLGFAKHCGNVNKIFSGENHIRIPINDIKNSLPQFISNEEEVQKVILFLNKPSKKFTLLFDYFRFE